ncbi:hypothetical protein CC85DRAFT_75589 [Cutaneotrichosporon oleaginosum]|uniref:Uncharacterized protein n=1 Tax=Cutaneotrichosporon oleaginosum TaxID=879819 RepID=A0A0J1B560_9TREE|nr:uncharacterized protein CC85DRAFT_75589 [Cutaneotrichosporon oleaginosum]KLT42834.1 hypothetical protein CC85DRAFT_75589 [Cutaneotrichosporon oleaginosum]TXT08200.1 hypothetical protein COLE_05124 [Cutaneotrichosporon oleaginosum]
MAPPQPTYVSSTGQLTTPPISKRVYDTISDYATIAYLFVETLVAPIVNPNPGPTAPRGQQPANGQAAPPRGGSVLGGSWGRGGGDGGNGGGGGGNSRFMSMNDLRGGDTVDSCRSACG